MIKGLKRLKLEKKRVEKENWKTAIIQRKR